MDIDTADAVEEKEHVHGIDAAGVVDMNVSGKEPPATIAHDVKTATAAVGYLGESLTSVFRGQPQVENIKPGGKFNCPEMLFKSVETQFLSSGMNAASLARKTKSTTYTPRQDSMGEGEVNGVCGKLNEVLKVTSELAVNKGNAETFQHWHARLLQCKKQITDMISH